MQFYIFNSFQLKYLHINFINVKIIYNIYVQKKSDELEEDDIDATKSIEKSEEEMTAALDKIKVDEEPSLKEANKLFYRRLARHYLADEARKENKEAVVTSAAYHKKSRILITGLIDLGFV